MTITKNLALVSLSALLLAGCAPTATPADGGEGVDSGVTAKGTPCEDNTSGISLYSDPSISESPEYGQSWGDGSPFVITYDDYTTGVLGYSISYVQEDGGAIPVTGGFFPDPVGTTFTSNDLYFNSTSDGYYGLVAVDLTTDTGTIEIGVYCVILAVSE
jgi:hypothetical protein